VTFTLNIEIPKLVSRLIKKHGTNDPEELADHLNATVISIPMGSNIAGYYKCLKRRRYIFINSNISDNPYRKVILAHELGHAIMHRTQNCAFMNGHTLLLTSKFERQANLFAAYLLIGDDLLFEYEDFTREQFCDCTGYPEELINLRLK
jgi:Zn-dependent peptidase ImmA (M78 family)